MFWSKPNGCCRDGKIYCRLLKTWKHKIMCNVLGVFGSFFWSPLFGVCVCFFPLLLLNFCRTLRVENSWIIACSCVLMGDFHLLPGWWLTMTYYSRCSSHNVHSNDLLKWERDKNKNNQKLWVNTIHNIFHWDILRQCVCVCVAKK